MIKDLLNLLFPRYCPVCGQRLVESEQLVCISCLVQLPYVKLRDFVDNPITRLFYGRINIERAYSHIFYRRDDASHLLITELKYNHRPDIGWKMGRMIAARLLEKGFFEGVDGIVPVPLHWRRFLKRGYNQSKQLARGLNEATHIPVYGNVVWRTTNNDSQTTMLGTEARMENMQDVFRARSVGLSHILLVDDVLTTGSTMMACALAILQCNPGMRFSVLTLAKAR